MPGRDKARHHCEHKLQARTMPGRDKAIDQFEDAQQAGTMPGREKAKVDSLQVRLDNSQLPVITANCLNVGHTLRE